MKKGFTLIELLAVLVIIGVIAMIAVPAVGNVINSSKQKAYDQQIYQIESAARNYMAKNSTKLPSEGIYCLNIDIIQEAGFLSNQDIIDPKTNEKITGYVIITNNENKYTYEYDKNNTCNNK